MVSLVIGGSGSGKSEFAEQLACKTAGKRYYIATMQPYDEEMWEKIKRHQEIRKDKGFETIECYKDLFLLECGEAETILLECMSNLLANEMYNGKQRPDKEMVEDILHGIGHIKEKCKNLVIVSNDVFSSGEQYEEETLHYIRLLGKINQALAIEADYVVEVVCGISVEWKKGRYKK